jgi:hypothetical protein
MAIFGLMNCGQARLFAMQHTDWEDVVGLRTTKEMERDQ